MTRVLFINAIDPISEVESRYPGLGLAYLVSSLRSHFGDNYFNFRIIESGSESEVKKQISEFRPDIVGISSVSHNFNLAKEYTVFAAGRNIPVIMGGVHISMLPHSLPKEAILGCIGEGERTIVEIFRLFESHRSFPKNELGKIKGIVYHDDGGRLVITEPAPLIDNLDEIEMPARDLLTIKKHSYIFSSRGCPYRCVFCASSRFWDRVRLFSAEYVVKEIKELHEKYGVEMISFFDDLFIINPQRLADIAVLLKKEGLCGKIKFTCSCRANLVNENIAKLLKSMGVVSIGMGLESGSKRILNYLKGETVSIEQNKKAVEILKKYDIAVNASFIIGSPDETKEEIMETYRFIKESSLDLVDIYILMPFPGTPVWDYAKEKNLVSDDMDWSKLTSNFDRDYRKALIISELYNREEIYKFYKKFRRLHLYLNAKNIWHSPFLMDLPKYAVKIIYEKAVSLLKKQAN